MGTEHKPAEVARVRGVVGPPKEKNTHYHAVAAPEGRENGSSEEAGR